MKYALVIIALLLSGCGWKAPMHQFQIATMDGLVLTIRCPVTDDRKFQIYESYCVLVEGK